MIKINLLPYWEKRQRQEAARELVLLGGAVLMLVVLLLGAYGYYSLSRLWVKDEVAGLEIRTAALARQVGDVEAYMKRTKDLKQKLAVIDKLEKDRFFGVRFLREMAAITPRNDVWLNKVSYKEGEVRFDGYARHNAAVARFMMNAERSVLFTAVELVTSKQEEWEKTYLQRFVVTARLTGLGAEAASPAGPSMRVSSP
jgi:Tfp pilus assembly protein PilN